MNDEAKPYNSLDLGLTFLLSPKVILTASATNILCRRNEFGRVDGRPVLASADHFFYVGVYSSAGATSSGGWTVVPCWPRRTISSMSGCM